MIQFWTNSLLLACYNTKSYFDNDLLSYKSREIRIKWQQKNLLSYWCCLISLGRAFKNFGLICSTATSKFYSSWIFPLDFLLARSRMTTTLARGAWIVHSSLPSFEDYSRGDCWLVTELSCNDLSLLSCVDKLGKFSSTYRLS